MDRENVIKGLECCSKTEFPYGEIECNSIGECPYTELAFEGKDCCVSQLIKDALAVLKGTRYWRCGKCEACFTGLEDVKDRRCPKCGNPFLWEGLQF